MNKDKDIFDALNELKDNNPFDVPEGYFDSFQQRMKERIERENETQRPGLIRMMKPWLGLAAGFLFIIALYITFGPDFSNTKTAEVNTEMFFDDGTLDQFFTEFNEYDLICYLTDCNKTDKQDQTNDINSEIEIDVTGLTQDDVEDLILF